MTEAPLSSVKTYILVYECILRYETFIDHPGFLSSEIGQTMIRTGQEHKWAQLFNKCIQGPPVRLGTILHMDPSLKVRFMSNYSKLLEDIFNV